MFQEQHAAIAYFLGGAHHCKPAHWKMSDLMFRVDLQQINSTQNYTLKQFSVIQPTTSKTAEAPHLAFAAGLTLKSDNNGLVGFSVNGKDLNLRSIESSITNEIYVYETLPKNTTYRTTIYRTPKRAELFPIEAKSKEVLQSGDIPPHMYGSTITLVVKSSLKSGEAVLIGGNLLTNNPSPIEIMLGKINVWQEKSSGSVFSLTFDLEKEIFNWKKRELEIVPRANHLKKIHGERLYIFGGVNLETQMRYDVKPVIVDIETWSILSTITTDDFPQQKISGQGFIQVVLVTGL